MALRLPRPPDGLSDEVMDRACELVDRAVERRLISRPRPRWAIAPPHQVYTTDFDALVQDKGLQAARPSTWRYIVMAPEATNFDEAEPVAAIDVDPDGQASLAATNVGPFVRALVTAVNDMESIGVADHEDFEVRILEIPAISCTALWLSGDRPDAQMLVPFVGLVGDWFRYPVTGERRIDAMLGDAARTSTLAIAE
jgi:hypothetical protein